MPQFETQCHFLLFCVLLVSCTAFVLSYTFVGLGYMSCTFSEKEVACDVVIHVVMNYSVSHSLPNPAFL